MILNYFQPSFISYEAVQAVFDIFTIAQADRSQLQSKQNQLTV